MNVCYSLFIYKDGLTTYNCIVILIDTTNVMLEIFLSTTIILFYLLIFYGSYTEKCI